VSDRTPGIIAKQPGGRRRGDVIGFTTEPSAVNGGVPATADVHRWRLLRRTGVTGESSPALIGDDDRGTPISCGSHARPRTVRRLNKSAVPQGANTLEVPLGIGVLAPGIHCSNAVGGRQ